MRVAGSGSRSVRCMNCLKLIRPSDKRGLFCTSCVKSLSHGHKKKPAKKKRFKILKSPGPSVSPVAPTLVRTRPLSDFVDIVPAEIIPAEIDDFIDSIDTPSTITGLREMRKADLIDLAIDLGLDPSGMKDDLINRLAKEIGII